MDPRIEKWAKLVVDYSVKVEKGDWVYLLTNSIEAKPLYDAVRREILRKGANVSDHFVYDPCGCTRTGVQHDALFLTESSEEQLDQFPEFKLAELNQMKLIIAIEGSSGPKRASKIPSWKFPRRMKTLKPLLDIRFKKGWVLTNYPTLALARMLRMPRKDLLEFVFSSLLLDTADPITEWQKVSQNQAQLIEFLKTVGLIRIRGRKTDLSLDVTGRTWENCDGHWNLPDGEIFTGPCEEATEGEIYFGDFPQIFGGKSVSGIRLKFQAGKVVKAEAEKGDEFLQTILKTDEGASRLGELGIGTNFGIRNPTKEILFDEKIGGTIHLALGDGYAETGSKNSSAIHWDLIKPLAIFDPNDSDQAELLVQKDGQWFRMIKREEELAFEKT